MSATSEDLSFEDLLARISELAEQLLAHPDRTVADSVGELLDWVDAMHREGLGQLVEMIRAWRGEIFLEAVAADEEAGALLAAYDLNEFAREAAELAVDRALAEIRPLAASHGGAIEVLRINDGVVEVRLDGTCNGCPSSSATLTHGVEAALRKHWLNFRRLEVAQASGPDPAKADLNCPVPTMKHAAPTVQLLQIRGHEQS